MKYPSLKLVSNENIEALAKKLQEDNHPLLFPSHVVEKDGNIVGALSIGSTPVSFFWMHSKESSPLDSLIAIQVAENIARVQGQRVGLVACSETSPFYQQMEKLGYKLLMKTVIFQKAL